MKVIITDCDHKDIDIETKELVLTKEKEPHSLTQVKY